MRDSLNHDSRLGRRCKRHFVDSLACVGIGFDPTTGKSCYLGRRHALANKIPENLVGPFAVTCILSLYVSIASLATLASVTLIHH